MNIEHRKTKLDDDSLLYQKRDETSEKKDLSGLTFVQKLGYFKDYYLKILVVILIAVVLAGSLIYAVVFDRHETVLSISFVNGAYLENTEGLAADLKERLGITDEKTDVEAAFHDLEQYQYQMAFTTLVASQAIDLVVCDEDYFKRGSELGMFADLREVLPEDLYKELEDSILESSETETDDMGEIMEYLPPAPRGIDISGSALYKEYDGHAETPILCVLKSAGNPDNAVKAITYFADTSSAGASVESEPEELQ